MRNLLIYCCLFFINIICFAQINPAEDYPKLFKEVQRKQIFKDQKFFADCCPLYPPGVLNDRYLERKSRPDFDLRKFVGEHFDTLLLDTQAIFKHIDHIWNYLERKPEEQDSLSSLIALPLPYIVPGGRFREIYYWDSYFTMLGLQVSGRIDIIESMVDNFAFLIDRYGYIPNGNRTYYLSRSQPPFFSLMIELLAKSRGDSIYLKYLPQLEKEYHFWTSGSDSLSIKNRVCGKSVLIEGGQFLNRYRDRLNGPRPESYLQDVTVFEKSGRDSSIFRDLRSAAESGWDFSSRWFEDDSSLTSIKTVSIIPVDLNCLLFNLEKVLEKGYNIKGDKIEAKKAARAAEDRTRTLIKHCFNADEGYFYDYNFVKKRQTMRGTLAGIYPLFFKMIDSLKAADVLETLKEKYLFDGGVVTSLGNTGQQWDYPNGWAPLQWIAYTACRNYGFDSAARDIAVRWTDLNLKVFFDTGKMLEKYNVVNTDLPGGGGEYELQDGFGWTNGVFLKLWSMERESGYIVEK